jgi:Tol biopolymer transport system component
VDQPRPAHWRQVESLFHATLAVPDSHREAYLQSQCGDDRALFDDVASLLRADAAGANTHYEDWAPHVAAAWAADTRRSLAGQNIGRYRVLERLGAGAMGEVYRAEDAALGRHVALKTLLSVAGDRSRLLRLQQEARAASALNHPNILTIHETGDVDGVHFIASEFVDGETLRDRLARGPLAVENAIDIARQVAAGLGAAHAAGVIHRDVKPENLMVRRDGLVKIVDFGLAEPIQPTRMPESRSHRERTPSAAGTLSYMSPEQARGEPLDARTDLFSLGVVFYEMLTGHVPFERQDTADTIDALLHDSPPWPSTVNASVPVALDAVVARALEKDRERRYQTAPELEAELRSLRRPVRFTMRRRIALATLGLAAVASSVLWVFAMRPSAREGLDPARLTFLRISNQAGEELFPSLTPSGDAVVYASAAAGNWDIYLHRVGDDPINLTADSRVDEIQPVYSPDGQRILFRSEREGGGLFVMPASGGLVTRVSDIGWDPAWSPDGGQIVCSTARVEPTTVRLPDSQLWVVDVRTGQKRQLLDGPAFQPQWSPSGLRIAFSGADGSRQRDLWTIAATGGDPVQLTSDRYADWNPIWSADGRVLYFLSDRGGTMNAWRMRIDEVTGRALEEPRPFTLPAANVILLARAAGSDALTWSSRVGGGMIQRYELDPARGEVLGKPASLTSPSRSLVEAEISPDGSLLVANTRGESRDDIVILRPDGTQVRALTEDEARDRYPRWSPDGRRVAFWSDRSGGTAVFVIDSDGGHLQRVSAAADDRACCPMWSPDGQQLAYLAGDLTIRALDLAASPGAARDRVLAKLPAGIWFQPVSWSPDGSRLAGQERRDNNPRAGVAIFDVTTKQYTRLTRSGGRPIWMNDNRLLVYSDASSAYVLDTISGQARELFSVAPHQNSDLTITRDNRHVYASVRANEADVWVTGPR